MGIAHIGATPEEWWGPEGFHLPEGIDHILFLLALILAGGTLGQMVKTATGFTVGHSITLAAGSLGLVAFPQRVVESAIALSIAYVAAETFFIKTPRDRWKMAAAFGLIHGLGFASALGELNLERYWPREGSHRLQPGCRARSGDSGQPHGAAGGGTSRQAMVTAIRGAQRGRRNFHHGNLLVHSPRVRVFEPTVSSVSGCSRRQARSSLILRF